MYKVMFRSYMNGESRAVCVIIESFSSRAEAETAVKAVEGNPPNSYYLHTDCIKLY